MYERTMKIPILNLYIVSKVHVVYADLGMILNRINIKAMRPHIHTQTHTRTHTLTHPNILRNTYMRARKHLHIHRVSEQNACIHTDEITVCPSLLTTIKTHKADPSIMSGSHYRTSYLWLFLFSWEKIKYFPKPTAN